MTFLPQPAQSYSESAVLTQPVFCELELDSQGGIPCSAENGWQYDEQTLKVTGSFMAGPKQPVPLAMQGWQR